METALTHYPLEPFRQPQNVISVRIDKLTGKLSNKTDRSSSFEFFQLGTAPTEYATDENLITIIEGENSDDELF